MPHAIVFAAKEFGSVGLHDFAVEQGIAQVIQLLKHVHSSTALGSTDEACINWCQLATGMSQPVLSDTWPLPHAEGLWLNSV